MVRLPQCEKNHKATTWIDYIHEVDIYLINEVEHLSQQENKYRMVSLRMSGPEWIFN